MSLKARLRIAIVALVTLVVIAMSALYLYDFTRISFNDASQRADLIADEVQGNLLDRLAQTAAQPTLEETKNNWTRIIRTDPNINKMLKRALANEKLVADIEVTDDHGKVLAAWDAAHVDTTRASAEDFRDIQRGQWLANLWDLMTRRTDYVTTRALGIPESKQVLFEITVVIKSVFLKNTVEQPLVNLALAFGAALFIAVFLASVLPSLVLGPLERISRRIDLIRTGGPETASQPMPRESPEFANVQSKLSLLSEQYRGAKQDAFELRSNVQQLLRRLEETVLVFDNAGRLMMAGEPAARMLGKSNDEMIGRRLDELFPPSTVLGTLIGTSVRDRQSLRDQSVTVIRPGASAVRLLVNVEVMEKSLGQEEIGTLVTFRDAESRRQLARQLDLSTRLAAIGRLSSGVAHEIKNPLNAMALHLEVLRGKLDGQQPEVDVIGREIKRLDGVVKTFLNFNKPIELQTKPIDLSELLEQVLSLVSVDARAKNIHLESALQDRLWINGDPDLLMQAILNVVNNGLEAMPEGGSLSARSAWDGDECEITIADSGPGIAPEIQHRIFNLYFTTKDSGSGIGLATTFRVVQLHSGTIDFISEPGKGTAFRLRFPRMVDYSGEVLRSATSVS
jgi:signal transduction histidine kinase